MRRKIVQHGSSSLTVSLPFSWAKKNGIKKGKEVDVKEMGKSILISAAGNSPEKTCTLRIKDSKLFFKRDLINLYKRGFDEVRLEFDDKVPMTTVLDKIDELLGFEIVEEGKAYCVIRNVANLIEKEFDTMLRRLFLVTLAMVEESYDKIKKKDYGSLSIFKSTEKENNKLANVCQRLLLMKGFDELDYTTSTYSIIDQLEMIGDAIGDFCEKMLERKQSPSDAMLSFFREMNSYFREIYTIFYSLERSKLFEIKNKRLALYNKIDNILESSSAQSKVDILMLCYMKQILESLHHIEFSLVKV